MNEHSKRRLSQVHPELARRVTSLIESLVQQGLTVEIVQGLRTFAEQDGLFAQGRTMPGKRVTNARGGQSNHNYGLAVDLCIFVNGKPNWEAPQREWQMIGVAAERLGLEWGGRWKFVDLPHVQLQGLSLAQCQSLYKQGGLPLVWERAAKIMAVAESPLPTAAVKAKSSPPVSLPSLPSPEAVPAHWPVVAPPLPAKPARQIAITVPPPKSAARHGLTALVAGLLAKLTQAGDWLAGNWQWLACVAAVCVCLWIGWEVWGRLRRTV